jgi:hypothetical protein
MGSTSQPYLGVAQSPFVGNGAGEPLIAEKCIVVLMVSRNIDCVRNLLNYPWPS